jgi:transcriptional regulator with XRE-family HTH domain
MHPVRKARMSAGLNYRELAEQSHVSSTTLKKVEDGEQVSELTVFKIATALGLDPEELLEDMREEHKAALDEKQPA